MRSIRFAWLGFACVSVMNLVACGGNGGTGDDDDDTPTIDADPDDPPDADNTGFVELIGRDWSIPPGEYYRCIGIRAEEDMLITTFRTPNPDGEHHTVLTVADDPGFLGTQLGEYDCDVNTLDLQMLFASGVGTDDLAFPEGVAMRVEAGQFVHLNLHLFNTQPSGEISGHSAVLVKSITEAELVHEAEMVFAGTNDISVPSGQMGEASGGCTFTQPATLLAYWPHMHRHAVHQKVDLTVDGVTTELHNADFDFREQYNYPLDPLIQVDNGDSINVTCTYDNTDGGPDISFGDSSDQEMCFTGLYRYPKQALFLFECSEGFP